jgi:hypothetical protein
MGPVNPNDFPSVWNGLEVHLASLIAGALGALKTLEFIKERRSGKPDELPSYKARFLEEQGALMRQWKDQAAEQTASLHEINTQLQQHSAVLLAKDENLIPRVFESPESKRLAAETHDAVQEIKNKLVA